MAASIQQRIVIISTITDPKYLFPGSIFGIFRDELALQKFSIARITSDPKQHFSQGIDGLTEPSEDAEFDAEMAGISFSEWIDRLTPVLMNRDQSLYDKEWKYQDEWFDKMVPTIPDSSNAVSYTCKDRPMPCKYRCY
ncbi:hypothetical protein N7517_007445 [Penicillium concentricum]|uniref:Uncharacterized protein n=1 Tax=Penicillium concentricum TaxID=293559 RepID=A0A9W9SDX6_9EURO|nr:uncharacterized protein N7517_007445 [Penicillium concentricum]KAJ5375439.1 hypothetical protein N7517_007445 [Penicillium concentricum]